MNIFLFGATGGTGKEILIKILEQKHQVLALVRNPDALGITADNLKIIKGSIYNPETYQNELSQCDLVISALGTGTSRKPTEIYSKGGQQIISAMQKANVKRLMTLTAGAFDPTDPATQNWIIKYIVQPLFKNIYSDMQKWETVLENNKGIDWTIIRPSRLTNGKEKGKYRVQLNHCPKGGSKINRSDLSDFIVKQINSDKYIHQKVAIAY
ncbi:MULTISPECIES: NAD(P)-dependent oxidoreductase [Chryseobacterium]|uniref:NAD(P)-dependent oxidoreductase n=1 Tax=Chryseobacterium TaxID=59732 RepID=UPI00195CBC24|nr:MULTISPECIES: SDR family oxidoreductase [Chryseobacterium]MBM7421349.1 putative NADH-flavin reductase [Chryseobacterium sp. JUb44]MDH6211310.1 putative NADH-flavin reductase [Chryseobacterium sp. BIGb0186]WSO09968.1 SDR family oxidoreductase [Chryseobacterium scophthalmum]